MNNDRRRHRHEPHRSRHSGRLGLLAALFVARDSANFGLVQAAVGLLLVVVVVAAVVALRLDASGDGSAGARSPS